MTTRRLLAAGLSALSLGAAATGAAAAPVWTDGPTVADAQAAYPPKARADRVGGEAVLSCTVMTDGRLHDCTAVSASPSGYNFDVAARRLASKLRLTPGPGTRPGTEIQVKIALLPTVLNGAPGQTPNPLWSALPGADDFQASFPKTENGVNDVRVALDCAVGAGGALDDCKVVSEDPAGQGYGAGALALASKFRTGLLSADGAPTEGGRVRLPIHYKLTAVTPPPAKP